MRWVRAVFYVISLTLAAAQTHIVQSLSYFENLSEPMAEFLQILSEQYDYPQLAEEVLKYVRLTLWNASHIAQGVEQHGI
jgi:hypothetical protein